MGFDVRHTHLKSYISSPSYPDWKTEHVARNYDIESNYCCMGGSAAKDRDGASYKAGTAENQQTGKECFAAIGGSGYVNGRMPMGFFGIK